MISTHARRKKALIAEAKREAALIAALDDKIKKVKDEKDDELADTQTVSSLLTSQVEQLQARVEELEKQLKKGQGGSE